MSAAGKSIIVQDRDFLILRGLLESRVMTSLHLAELYFEGRKEAAKKRLQRLKSVGFIGERHRRAYEPSILFLTRAGLLILRSHGILAEYPPFDLSALERRARVSDATLRHEIEIMDVKAAFHTALRGHDRFSVAEFGTWPRLYEFQATRPLDRQPLLVKPDGFVRIHEKEPDDGLSEHVFFLEVDRSSEVLSTLVSRAEAYFDYYKSGGFAARNGASRSVFRDYPFRVLMVFKTAERQNNFAERLLQTVPPILSQVCLSTFDEVTVDPVGDIWIRPTDYRASVKGTEFAPESRPTQFGYQRQTAREVFVRDNVERIKILS